MGNNKNDIEGNNDKKSFDNISHNVALLVPILKVKKEKKKGNMSCINTTVQFIDNITSNIITNDNNKNNDNNNTTSSSSSSIQHTKSNTSGTNKLKSSLKHNSSSSSILSQNNDLNSNIISTSSSIQTTTTTIPTITTTSSNTDIVEIPSNNIIKKESNKINSEINYTNPHDTIILNNILTINLQIKNKLIEECNIIIELLLRKRYCNLSECKLFEIGGTRKRKLLDSSLSSSSAITTGIKDITSGLTTSASSSSATETKSTGSVKIEESNDC